MGINIITANFTNGGRDSITRKLYQYDYGQKVSLRGLSLPNIFEVHISNQNDINTAEVYTGRKNEIDIPDKFLLSGQNIYMWLFLHAAAADGQTRYTIMIPVEERPKPQPAVPTVDNNIINDLLINALQNGLDGQPRNSAGINVTTAKFNGERDSITRKLYQYDYGQIISIKGLNLPKVFEVHISNSNKASTAEIYIGKDNEIEIPDKFLLSGEDIYLWIFLHSTAEDGETRYTITVPVKKKPKPEGQEPTVVERNTIDELIAALEINLNEMRQATEDAKNAMDEATAAAKEQMQLAIDKANDVVSKYPKIIEDYWYIYDVENQVWVNTQIKALAVDGVGIENIVYNNDYTITINLTDGTSYTTESIRGQKGDKGDTGATPNIKIQSTETLAPNQYANVTIEGTPEEPRLTFRIPKGEKGDKGDTGAMPQISIGTVETLLPHRSGYVTQTGTTENPVLNFGLVKGETGEQGPQGQKGDTGETGPQGIQGQIGPKGEKGQQGIQGETGPKGDKGDTGERGQTGKNAYEYAADGGYTGSENDFSERLAHIKTPQEIDQSITNAINNSGHYIKPTTGIPKSDLDINVQTSLGKADTAVQDLTEVQTSIQELTTRLNTLIDSDDVTLDQLSEIVVYIKNNKSLIDNITTGKISVTDIVDNLTSNVANKPLSAKQGKVLKDLIDAIVIPTKVSDLTDDSGHYTKPSGGIPASDLADGVIPVEDVQVNGVSVLNDGVANVPIAGQGVYGAVKVSSNTTGTGLTIDSFGNLAVSSATVALIKEGTNSVKPITPNYQHQSTFYGLAKAAGDTTQSSSNNAVGNYTDSAKTAIKNMLGVPEDPLAAGTALPASADLNSYTTPGNYTADSTVIASITHAPTTTVEYKLTVEQISDEVIKQTVTTTEAPANVYQRTGDSSSTDWVFGDWVKEIKSTDYATAGTGGQSGQPGIVKIGDGTVGIGLASNGELRTISASAGLIKAGTSDNRQISPMRQHEAVFYGLTKAAGVDMSSSSNALGTYTDDAKAAIQDMLDVPSNSDHASRSQHGLVKLSSAFQLNSYDEIVMSSPPSSLIKNGTSSYVGLTPQIQHESVFYGLAKASGDTTQSVSDNAVGTYTDNAKSAIQNMLGISDGYVTKESIDNAGITDRTYTTVYGGEFTVTTAKTDDYEYPVATISCTPRPTYYSYRVTYTDNTNEETTEYIIPGRTWIENNGSFFSYLGNLEFFTNNMEAVPGGTDTQCPFFIKERYSSPNYFLDIFTETAGSYTFLVEKIEKAKTVIPSELIYGIEQSPVRVLRASENSAYLGLSIGTENFLYSHTNTIAIGNSNVISSSNGIAIGRFNQVQATGGVAEGHATVASGQYSHATGYGTIASGNYAHSAGYQTTASGISSHSAGVQTTASGYVSNAEGYNTKANAFGMYAIGEKNVEDTVYADWVSGTSYVVGDYVSYNGIGLKCITANSDTTFDQNKWKFLKSNGTVAFVIGNGGILTTDTPSNAYKVDWDGNGYYNGDVYVNCAADSTGGTKLISEVDYANDTTPGVIKTVNYYGTATGENGRLEIYPAQNNTIKTGTTPYQPIVPAKQHMATFYGLAKAAGSDMKNSNNTVGTYTNEAKSAIQNMLGISDKYVTKDSIDNAGITNRTYTSLFGGQFSVTTATTENYINPYARATVTGRISKHYIYRVTVNETQYILPCRLWYLITPSEFKVYEYIGNLNLYISDVSGVPGGTDNVPFIIISDLNDANSIDVLTSSAGTYNILIERINNTQIELPKSLIYGDAYEPIIKKNHNGTYNGYSLGVNELLNSRGTFAFGYGNTISQDFGTSFGIGNEVTGKCGIASGVYNLVSGEGASVEGGSNGATGNYSHAEGYETKASKMSAHSEGYQTAASGNAAHAEGVGTTASGNFSHAEGDGATASANDSHAEGILTIAASQGQHVQGKYNIEDSNNTYAHIIGGGTDNNHRTNIQAIDWNGNEYLKGNVYINCATDSTNGTKLISETDYATTTKAGLVRVNGNGVQMVGDRITLIPPTNEQIKAGTAFYAPLGPGNQHRAVFYGLAKAAGDTTQSSSNNAVGTYTTEAKSAIRSMLGIENAATIIIEVQGTSPTITAQPNIRYTCGEVTSITITPPQIGICDVIFTSGSTPAILTLPNTVKMPDWVDLTILEANTIYEINIVDGIYGTVMTWKI